MSQALFITGTGAGVGKTTAAIAMLQALADMSYDTAYYKPVVTGTDSIPESDAGRVRAACDLEQDVLTLTSYVFKDAVSPHLAAAQLMQPVDQEMIAADFASVSLLHDATIVEGTGGIICPYTLYADGRRVMQADVVKALGLASVIVADSGPDTLNATLYFLDETGGLTPVEMTLDLYEGDTQAGAVVKALLEGTEEKDWLSAIPEGFQVTSVRLEESTCYVDLPTAALPGLPEEADLSLALRALADSLLSLRAVEEVRYLVDGEFASAYGGAAVLEPYLSAA